MRNHLDGSNTTSVTRRDVLHALATTISRPARALAAGFTAIADDLAWLMRWCCFDSGPRFAGAG